MVLACALVYALPAWTQDSVYDEPAPDKKESDSSVYDEEPSPVARRFADDGRKLFDSGQYEQAAAAFQKALAEFKAPQYLVYIGKSYINIGRLIEAREQYDAAARMVAPVGASEKFVKKFNDAKARAATALADIQDRIPAVRLAISGPALGDVRITEANSPVRVSVEQDAVRVEMNPGDRVLSIEATGFNKVEVQVKAAERSAGSTIETMTLTLTPAQSVPSPPSSLGPKPGANEPVTNPSKKVTHVVPGQAAAAPAPSEEPAVHAPGLLNRILLELGVSGGASVRLDNSPELVTISRAGIAYGGSIFVWPSRSLAFGMAYTHADLSSSSTPTFSPGVINVDYGVHALMVEARIAPFRINPAVALFATIGGGLAWQTASLRATLASINGSPGGSTTCGFGSNPELVFRAGLGIKARIGRAAALIVDGNFTGWRARRRIRGGGRCLPMHLRIAR